MDIEVLLNKMELLEALVHQHQLGALALIYNATQAGRYQPLVSNSGSIAINLAKGNNYKHTLTEDTTLEAPIKATAGQAGVIEFTQGAGPYTLAFDDFWCWPGGTDGELTATESAVDVMSYIVSSDATFATCVMLGDSK